jgi:hypothetical protein
LHRFWNSLGRSKVSLLTPALLTIVASLALSACGASSSSTGSGSGTSARTLLSETFTGKHTIDSGDLSASITVDPTGSTLLTQPLSLTFGGPFQSRGKNQLPKSNFAIAVDVQGQTGRLGILSTGTEGFVTLGSDAYKLPAANFKQLEGSVSAVGGGSSSSSTLSGLGIHPQNWLIDPAIVGTAQIGGTQTEHIRGTLAVKPLLSDLSKLLAKASTLSSSTSTLKAISPAEQAKIAGEVKNASFDLWTGSQDHTIRKLTVTATLPVTGTLSTELGGMTSAKLSFGLTYSDIGQPQTVTAPTSSKPYSQFTTRLQAIVLEIEELAVGVTSGTSTSTTSGSGTTGSSAGSGSTDSAYSQCVSAAGSSVAKLQKCAALLNGSGG